MGGNAVQERARRHRAKTEPLLERLLLSTRSAPVPIALFDHQRRFLAASAAWEQVANLEGRAYLGKRLEAVIPDLPAAVRELHRRSARGEHLLNNEEPYVGADGETRWLCCEYRPVGAFDQQPIGYFVHANDVTPLMQARREAHANADRLKLALGAARAGVSEFDFVGKTVWFSPEFQDIVGAEIDFRRFAREPWYMAHPDDRRVIDEIVAGWTGPRHEPMDFRIILPSGGERWVQAHAEQQMGPDGRRAKVVGLVLDIDSRKRQEIALAEARHEAQINAERLGLALKAARFGVFEVSFASGSFWCSPEFVEIVGRVLCFDDVSTPNWPILHPDDAERVQDVFHEGFAAFALGSVEARILLPSGEDRWIHFSGELTLKNGGERDKFTGLVLDIDARKRQELALAEARRDLQTTAERMKLAMDAARAGVFETNFKTQTFWCSPEFVEIVGRPLTFQESLGVWPMTHPDDIALVQGSIDRSQGGQEPMSALEWRLILPSGETRWIDGRAVLHADEAGVPEKLIGLVLDIGERKQQELALIEAERAAQTAGEAKAQFLANMSHEIRTPMNGVLGVLHLLQKENLSEEGRHLLQEAGNCGRMLSQLLDDVIDFSRIEAGRLELSPEPTDAAEVLRSVAELLKPNALGKGLDLHVHAEAETAWISADPVRLRQALFNLIGNAVKFTTRGRVEARLTLTDDSDRLRLRFEIEDTGIGIPAAVQGALFSRFQQADGSTSRRFGGSGLGLAITRRLAELMDGEVGFSSRDGEGSTFWLEISAPRAQPRQSRPVETAAPVLDGMRVLLVEDNPTNRLVASKMLEALGVEVSLAEHGGLGVEAARTGAFDLILMDVQMPVMDGVEATCRIRQLDGPKGSVPIIGLTANAMAHQREAYVAAGMNGVVAKPISPAMLVAEIARVLFDEGASTSFAAA